MKIGLVLSGGGARGIAHLGVLEAMETLNLTPNIVSGSSAGALVGALYCAGYKPAEIKKIIDSTGVKRNLTFSFNRLGLFSYSKIEKILRKYLPETFEELKIPLVVCTTNIKKGKTTYFAKGGLILPVLASCAIPGIFMPVVIDGKRYIDGGVLNNIPVEPIVDECDFLVGVDLMPEEPNMPANSAKEIIIKCMMMSVGRHSNTKAPLFNAFIQPTNIARYNGLKLEKSDELFILGYNEAMLSLKNMVSV